jgi:hypothetical protein
MGEWMYRSTFSWTRHWLEVSGQLHAPVSLPWGKSPGTSWIGGWVGPTAGLAEVDTIKEQIVGTLMIKLVLLNLLKLWNQLNHYSLYDLSNNYTSYILCHADPLPGKGSANRHERDNSTPTGRCNHWKLRSLLALCYSYVMQQKNCCVVISMRCVPWLHKNRLCVVS